MALDCNLFQYNTIAYVRHCIWNDNDSMLSGSELT